MEGRNKIVLNQLKRAIRNGNLGMFARIVEKLERFRIDINSLEQYTLGIKVLMLASEGANPVMVDTLCRMGADVNATDSTGSTALHYASAKGNSASVIRLCRQPGINPNITRVNSENLGESPLMYACWKCTPEAVGALIRCGADVSAARQVDDRFTPLMYAIHNVHGPIAARRCVELLLVAGADSDALDSDGEAVFNHYKWEEVRTAGPGENLPIEPNAYKTYKRKKGIMNELSSVKNIIRAQPHGENFGALRNKYSSHPAFARGSLGPNNPSLLRNSIGGGRQTRRHRRY